MVEGGNVFKNMDKQAATQRINQNDVRTTIAWLEHLIGTELSDNMLGTTGKTPTSGDIDLAIDTNTLTREQLVKILTQWCAQNRFDPRDYIKSAGNQVHFRAPINGRPDSGWVQVDFMLVSKPSFARFALGASGDSRFKGADRNAIMNVIGKMLGYKLNQNVGLVDRDTNQLITDDPEEIATLLLGKGATVDDLDSVESIVQAVGNDDKKLNKIRDYFKAANIPFFESTDLYQPVDELSFLARLRDRIVNQGMVPIFESDEVQGGQARGIEHLEDLVFRRGSAGIQQAVKFIDALARDARACASAKMDGKPAILFGRNPDGEFVLTDTAGFSALGYDGLFTDPEQLAERMRERDRSARRGVSDRAENLTPIYQALWPQLEAVLPENFRGYVQGDLMYTQTPPEDRGHLVFTPNTVTYRIPIGSDLGQKISNSAVGIAVHTRCAAPGEPKQPLGSARFNQVPGVLLIHPVRPKNNVLVTDRSRAQALKTLLKSDGKHIDTLFNPAELRSMQISNLPSLCVDYINSLIADPAVEGFDAESMLPGFVQWLRSAVSMRKFANICEYLQSPTSNTDALAAAFSAFMLLHDIKMDLLQQLDEQEPGHEGWVVNIPEGVSKLVNRFGFTRANRFKNNP